LQRSNTASIRKDLPHCPKLQIPEFAAAFKTIENSPDSAKGHVMLASAYIKHAARPAISSSITKPEAAIDDALRIEPQNLNARKLKASLLATFHRFTEARAAALDLENEIPNDPFIYGVMTDANDELGNYTDAIASAQKMVDLKPNASSYARVGHIRSLHGDHKAPSKCLILAIKNSRPDGKRSAGMGLLFSLGRNISNRANWIGQNARLIGRYPSFRTTQWRSSRRHAFRGSKGDLARAEQLLTDLKPTDPTNTGVHFAR
jgi:tetratricopeptide (TPR) repeat protein